MLKFAANESRRAVPTSKILHNYCTGKVKKFLQETSLHGLRFVADSSISFWERSFFLCAFIAAFVTTANLISNIYAKWNSTPVIVGISPHPTSIYNIPFPAITVCNMNQVQLSKVSNYSDDSFQSALLQILCYTDAELDERLRDAPSFKNNNLTIADFVINHAQPCSKMLFACDISSTQYNCSDLFSEVMTDEGLCCVFNVLKPNFLFKGDFRAINDLTGGDGSIPVDWNPETGYPPKLPVKYSPRSVSGTGVSMGLSIFLNAEIDEYFCSSTNGPGFKILLHNPIETPNIKEAGLSVAVGHETKFRIDTQRSEASPSLRSVNRNARQCLFNNEVNLLYFKYYTRRNCENECQAKHMYQNCYCIPYNLPLIFANASVCSAKESFCITRAEKSWLDESNIATCRKLCLPSCFDLSFKPDAFSAPLLHRDYKISSRVLQNMSKDYIHNNIAVIHFYFRETVFNGDLKNVYIGLTEFLCKTLQIVERNYGLSLRQKNFQFMSMEYYPNTTNTGGIMGLFMGFSFISIAEIFYFIFLRPVFELILPQSRATRIDTIESGSKNVTATSSNWFGTELINPTKQPRFVNNSLKWYKPGPIYKITTERTEPFYN